MNFIREFCQIGFLGVALLVLVPFGLLGNVICSILALILKEKKPRLRSIVIGALLAAAPASALMFIHTIYIPSHPEGGIGLSYVIPVVIIEYFWLCYFVFVPQWLFLVMAKKIHFSDRTIIAWRLGLTALLALVLGFAHAFIGHSILGLPSD